ncbi:hypothetical protein [Natrinema soli]|uniref:Uncharacterized protein n=1 Tax=Natrinema soli TaxID=1930624 RepID=A0ABD5SPV9_9EURY|nr:hypothetical protein [Natrinema soli]
MARELPDPDDSSSGVADDPETETINRRSYLKLAGGAAAALGTSAGVSSAAPDDVSEGMELIDLDYGQYSTPSDVYDVNDNRSGIRPEFVSSPTNGTERALRTEFSSAQKTANLEYRFEENGYDMPSEVYTRFDIYPDGIQLEANDTVRIFWLPLTNGTGSSGGDATDGTNGWSNAIGFANRNDSPAPDGYNFFSYSYHMDRSGSGEFQMTSAPIWMDQWNEVEGYVRCNTVSNGRANRDGVMRYWVNGELAFERTGMRFTTSDSNQIEGVGPLGYVVGSNLSGGALVYDNHEIAIGGVPGDRDDSPSYDDDPNLVEPGERDQYDELFTYRNVDREAEYRVYVDGDIVQSDWGQATYNDTVEIATDEYAVVEAVAEPETVDGYFFDGEIVAISADPSPSELWVSGERIDPDDYPDTPADEADAGDEPLENVILVDGLGTTGTSEYEFEVGGAVEKATIGGASISDEDGIEAGHVTGSVAGWRDAFRFSGDLEQLTVDGAARVLIDGEPVDPAEYGDELPNLLTIVGNGTETSYEATVDAAIDTVLGDASASEAELLSSSTVSGTIDRGVHRFRFAGDLVDFSFEAGETHVYVGDQRIDPADYDSGTLRPPNAIVIDGTEADGRSEYSFAVDGDVIKSTYRDATIDPTDALEGTSVDGTVADGELDAYWFDGDIDDFSLLGDASVNVYHDLRDADE